MKRLLCPHCGNGWVDIETYHGSVTDEPEGYDARINGLMLEVRRLLDRVETLETRPECATDTVDHLQGLVGKLLDTSIGHGDRIIDQMNRIAKISEKVETIQVRLDKDAEWVATGEKPSP